MKIERVIDHLLRAAAEPDPELVGGYPGLSAAGAAIGDELPRNRLWLLQRLRAEVARLPEDGVDPYVCGYRMAIRDILASYESAVENNIRNMVRDPDEPRPTRFGDEDPQTD